MTEPRIDGPVRTEGLEPRVDRALRELLAGDGPEDMRGRVMSALARSPVAGKRRAAPSRAVLAAAAAVVALGGSAFLHWRTVVGLVPGTRRPLVPTLTTPDPPPAGDAAVEPLVDGSRLPAARLPEGPRRTKRPLTQASGEEVPALPPLVARPIHPGPAIALPPIALAAIDERVIALDAIEIEALEARPLNISSSS